MENQPSPPLRSSKVLSKMPSNPRQHRLSVLSRAAQDDIQAHWSSLAINPGHKVLKAPESGMVMVKAKAGGTGQPFNMGEMTVTRTVVQLATGEIGYGYTQGQSKAKSTLIALIDACSQCEAWETPITQHVIQPLENLLQQKHQKQQQKTDGSKVNFFTMVRGE